MMTDTKQAVDLAEATMRESAEAVLANLSRNLRHEVQRLDGRPRRPKEPAVKLLVTTGIAKNQCYLLYIGTEDASAVKRVVYDGQFLVDGKELAPESITQVSVITDMTKFAHNIVTKIG